MSKYRVAVAGLGPRGRTHVEGFLANPDRFELVALCDLDHERLRQATEQNDGVAAYRDAETMLAETRPDVYCFATLPHLRLSMVEFRVSHQPTCPQ